LPTEFLLDGGLERLGGGGFTVDEIGLSWRGGEGAEPTEEFAFAGMGGELAEGNYFRVDRDFLAEEAEGFRAFLQCAAASALGLEAGENYGVARVRQALG
jgi:hypothetical protein